MFFSPFPVILKLKLGLPVATTLSRALYLQAWRCNDPGMGYLGEKVQVPVHTGGVT